MTLCERCEQEVPDPLIVRQMADRALNSLTWLAEHGGWDTMRVRDAIEDLEKCKSDVCPQEG